MGGGGVGVMGGEEKEDIVTEKVEVEGEAARRRRERGETKGESDGGVSELCGAGLHGRFCPIIYKR